MKGLPTMPPELAQPVAADVPVATYRERKQALLERLQHVTLSSRSVDGALRHLTALTDDTLRSLWQACGFDGSCALLAVGGYGRAELFPHSDVDVLLLLPEGTAAADDAARKPIEAFIGSCWDAGLEI